MSDDQLARTAVEIMFTKLDRIDTRLDRIEAHQEATTNALVMIADRLDAVTEIQNGIMATQDAHTVLLQRLVERLAP